MQLALLQNKFAPITKEIGFLECDLKPIAEAYHSWMAEILLPLEMRIEAKSIEGSFETALQNLLPLTVPTPCRFAFVPTKSNWTAYFDNSRRGTDSSGAMHVLSKRLNCRSIRAVHVLNTTPKNPSLEAKGHFGATIFEVFENGKAIRTLYAANDGGKWKFGQSGNVFSFEETNNYEAKKISERFTGEMLNNYLQHFGINFFEEDFYTSGKPAVLFSRHGKLPPNLKEFELENP
jgi:hypothetical protein